MILNILERELNSYNNNPYDSHEESALLLPWYINKTLNSSESELVESHLKVCLTCKRELATLQKFSYGFKKEDSNKTNVANFTKLIDRINATTNNAANNSLNSPIKGWQHQSLPTANQKNSRAQIKRYQLPRPALAMAAALMLTLIIPRFIIKDNSLTNDFHTLSNAEIPNVNNNSIRIIFLDDTNKTHINNLLGTVHGHITSGPSAQGEYSVAIENKLTPENVQGVIAELKKNTNILFAEPAYALVSSNKTIGN
jgi:hypothetical protein